MTRVKSVVSVLGLSALILGPLAPLVPFVGAESAYAKGGNGGGNGNGNGGASHASAGKASAGQASHGKLASELKGLNAVHASATALANASPNSQVGRIAAYRAAALAGQAANEDLAAAQEDLASAQDALAGAEAALKELQDGYTGRTTAEVDAEIAGLDPAASDYQSRLDALNAEKAAAAEFEAEQAARQAAVTDAQTAAADAETAAAAAEVAAATAAATEEDALLDASNGRVLSPEAIEYVRTHLGL